MTYLLDANVLIAVAIRRHVHHDRAVDWLAQAGDVAICPIVEGALVRFLLRTGEGGSTAREVVRRLRSVPSCAFWPNDISYADLDLERITGHRQVTDAYLVGLALHRSAVLATFDEGLVRIYRDGATLVP